MKRRLAIMALTIALSLSGRGVDGAIQYTVTDLGPVGTSSTGACAAFAINDNGQVVGSNTFTAGSSTTHAFLYDSRTGQMRDLGSLGGSSVAYDINNLGQVVGSSYNADSRQHAFLSNGTDPMIDLGPTVSNDSAVAYAINDLGQIVGSSGGPRAISASGIGPLQTIPTFATITSTAKDINRLGQIVGSATLSDTSRAYLYEADGTLHNLGSPSGNSWANAVNDLGVVVGGFQPYGVPGHAAMFSVNAAPKGLGVLGIYSSDALDVNNSGLIVGTCIVNGGYRAFTYRTDNGLMQDLNTVIDPSNSWTLASANAINSQGQIVGTGTRSGSSVTHAFLLNPIAQRSLTWTATDGNWDVDFPTSTWRDGTDTATYREGDNVTFDGPTGGTVNVGWAGVYPTLITVANTSGTYTFQGGEINGPLVKSGDGTLSLGSPNTFTTVCMNEGILETHASRSLGSGLVSLDNGVTWKVASTQNQASQLAILEGGATIDVPTSYTLTLTGSGSSLGAFTKAGAGTLVLPSTFNTQAGSRWNVSAGIVRTGTGTYSNRSASLSIAGGAVLDGTRADSPGWGSLTGDGTYIVKDQSTLTLYGSCTFAGRLTAGSVGVIGETPETRRLSLIIGGSGGEANPTIRLTGTNDFAGAIQIQKGKLVCDTIGNRGEPGPLGLGLVGGAVGSDFVFNNYSTDTTPVLQYIGPSTSTDRSFQLASFWSTIEITNPSTTLTVKGAVNGSSYSFTKSGPGTLELTGTGKISTTTSVNEGVLKGNSQNLAGWIYLSNNANVTFDQTSDGVFSNGITGAGTITKAGSGALKLSMSADYSSYTGPTFVSGGTLEGTPTNLKDVVLSNGANVTFNSTSDATLTRTISGTGSFTKAGGSLLFMGTATSYVGPTIISGGTLRIGQPSPGPVAGATLWLDASTLNLPNGAVVTSLSDLGTSHNNAVATGSPTFVANGLNGMGVINFNGAQGLVTQNNLGIAGSSSRSMFVVMRRNGDDTTGMLAVQTGNGANGQGWGLTSQPNWFGTYVIAPGGAQAYTRTAGAYEVYSSLHQNGVPSGGGTNYIYYGGGYVSTGTNTPDIYTPDAPLAIGVGPICTSAMGDFAEVLVYNSYLNDTQRKQVETYLNTKWFRPSVSNPLPATTPMTVSAGATFDLNAPQTIGSLSGDGSVTLGYGGLLTVNGGAATTFSGGISGIGSLVKTGSGKSTLAGLNSYTGPTTISGGKLAIDGSLASPTVAVNGGGAIGGRGVLSGKVTVAGGSSASTRGAVSLEDGVVGRLTLSDPNSSDTALTLGGMLAGTPAIMDFEVGETADNILLSMARLMVNPGGATINISPLDDFHAGVYDLISFNAGQATGLDRLSLGTTTLPGYKLSLQSTPTAEQLVVSAVPEPSTLALLSAGVVGLLAYALRRRQVPRF